MVVLTFFEQAIQHVGASWIPYCTRLKTRANWGITLYPACWWLFNH